MAGESRMRGLDAISESRNPINRSWTFDELAHAGLEHRDPAFAKAYDEKIGPDGVEEVAAELALLLDLGLDRRSTLVDLGAGTGSLAVAAAPHCRRVAAVDVSEEMLAVLREKLRASGRTNVACVRAGYLTYEHEGDLADFVYSRNALHHLPDFWKAIALTRIAGFLKPGGVLRLRDLVFAFPVEDAPRFIGDWLGGARRRPEDGWTRPELETHLRTEFSTFSWLLEPMLARAGFEVEDVVYDDSRVYAAYTCVKVEE
jgi:SAM-dependent methyltransferase